MFARSLGFKREDDWREFCKGNIPEKGSLPADIPASPSQTYANSGWQGMGDWLGTGNIATYLRPYRKFEEARSFARRLGLKSRAEWIDFCRGNFPKKGILPPDIPVKPNKTYANKGWSGMGDWLGTGTVATSNRRFRNFTEARAFARSLGLRSQTEWLEFSKSRLLDKGSFPLDLPTNPQRTYASSGWIGYGDWLNTGTVAAARRKFRPFAKARAYARRLGINSQIEWREFCKGLLPEKGNLPADVPTNPHRTYADKGWSGYGDWLGTNRTRVSKFPKGD